MIVMNYITVIDWFLLILFAQKKLQQFFLFSDYVSSGSNCFPTVDCWKLTESVWRLEREESLHSSRNISREIKPIPIHTKLLQFLSRSPQLISSYLMIGKDNVEWKQLFVLPVNLHARTFLIAFFRSLAISL